MSTKPADAASPNRPNYALWGLLLTLPSTLVWLLMLGSAALHNPALAAPAEAIVDALHIWFIVPVLLIMPFAGGVTALLGFKRAPALAIPAILLGFGAAGLNILMQTAK